MQQQFETQTATRPGIQRSISALRSGADKRHRAKVKASTPGAKDLTFAGLILVVNGASGRYGEARSTFLHVETVDFQAATT